MYIAREQRKTRCIQELLFPTTGVARSEYKVVTQLGTTATAQASREFVEMSGRQTFHMTGIYRHIAIGKHEIEGSNPTPLIAITFISCFCFCMSLTHCGGRNQIIDFTQFKITNPRRTHLLHRYSSPCCIPSRLNKFYHPLPQLNSSFLPNIVL